MRSKIFILRLAFCERLEVLLLTMLALDVTLLKGILGTRHRCGFKYKGSLQIFRQPRIRCWVGIF